jgi:hypothetical protein
VHVFGATVVWTAMLWFYDGLTRHRPETSPTPGATPTPDVVATTGATPTPDAVTPTPVTVSPARP